MSTCKRVRIKTAKFKTLMQTQPIINLKQKKKKKTLASSRPFQV